VQHYNKTPVDTEKKAARIKYPAETTARSRENSPTDVPAYQPAQITSNPRMIQKHTQYKGNIIRLYPRNRSQYKFKKKQSKLLQFPD
jgi:hypothetical protein